MTGDQFDRCYRCMKPRIMITVDVEAMPRRSAASPLDRLIWGRFPEGEFGIQKMMSIAEKAGVTMTMMLDYAEVELYGDGLLDVGREIERRGHDLQLHLHQTFLSKSFWEDLTPVNDLNVSGTAESDAMLDYLLDQHSRISASPKAFRGGGYRFSAPFLSALGRHGIADLSCNASRATQPIRTRPRGQFLWSLEDRVVLEIPVSCVSDFRGLGRTSDYNFNAYALFKPKLAERIQLHRQFLKSFYEAHGTQAIAVLVLHSWSFLKLDENKQYFSQPDPAAVEAFGELINALAKDFEIITAARAVDLFDSGKLAIDEVLLFADEPERSNDGKPSLLSNLRRKVLGRA